MSNDKKNITVSIVRYSWKGIAGAYIPYRPGFYTVQGLQNVFDFPGNIGTLPDHKSIIMSFDGLLLFI